MHGVTVREAISAAGGIPAVARALGAKPSRVSMWAVRDSVPADYLLPLWKLCLQQGVAWEPPGADAIRHLLTAAPQPADRKVA